MRILIIGTGAMGTIYGWALTNAGHEVLHYVRPEKRTNPDGEMIQVQLRDWRSRRFRARCRTYTYRVIREIPVEHDFELIMAPVLHFHYRELAPLLRERGGQALMMPFGNHWNDFELLEAQLSGRYLFGFPHHGGMVQSGILYGMLNSRLSLAEPNGQPSERLQRTAKLFRAAGFRPRFPKSFTGWCRVHFAWNTAIMTSTIRIGNIYEFRRNRRALRHAFELMRETMRVVEATGANPADFPEGRMAAAPLWWNVLLTQMLLYLPGMAQMAEAQLRRNQLEIKKLYYDLWQTARDRGIPTPLLDACQPFVNML